MIRIVLSLLLSVLVFSANAAFAQDIAICNNGAMKLVTGNRAGFYNAIVYDSGVVDFFR